MITGEAMRCVCYALQKLEAAGDLEIFISEEIDKLATTTGGTDSSERDNR